MKLSVKHTIYSLLLILVTTFLFHIFYEHQVHHPKYQLSVLSTHQSDGTMELYYDVGDGFNEADKTETIIVKGENKSVFNFENKARLKRLRLDFGDHRRDDTIAIKTIRLESDTHSIFSLDGSKIIKNITKYSPNVQIAERKLNIADTGDNFDPYIEFKTLNRIVIPDWTYVIVLLFPILLVYCKSIYRHLKSILADQDFNGVFMILFLCTIPFKDAWTTFIVLLWIGYVMSGLVRKRVIEINLATLTCLVLFTIPLIFGKVSSYDQINILLSFLLFTVISFYSSTTNPGRIRDSYSFIINVIALVIIGSWVNYMFYYAHYDNVTFGDYFRFIKYTNENIREWMGYSHPAYISIFSIIAVLFSFESYRQKRIHRDQLVLTLLIAFVLTVILGSRIALLILLTILALSLFSIHKYKKFLLVLFSIFSIAIFATINKIDPIRNQLWSISINAIKERPLFGYGLGSSEDLILDQDLNKRSGYDSILILNHPHNQYINYVLEIGAIGFVFLIGLLLLVHLYHKEKINRTYVTMLFIWGIVSIVESPFETSKSTFLFCFFLMITCGSPISKISVKRFLNSKSK